MFYHEHEENPTLNVLPAGVKTISNRVLQCFDRLFDLPECYFSLRFIGGMRY